MNRFRKLINFHKKAEKLKTTTRHSWLSNNRQESTAEHSWMLSLLAMVLADKIDKKIDLFKVIKMVTVHDLPEAIKGDIPAWEVSKRQQNKNKIETKSLNILVKDLPKRTAKEIVSLWREFEERRTPEAKFANSLDKIDAIMQHNISSISKWRQGDFNVHPYYRDEFFNFDSFMRAFKDVVDVDSMKKIIKAKATHRIDSKHLERYKKNRR